MYSVQKRIINFKGVCSGDGESFCFDVDRETFISVVKKEPEDSMDYQSGEHIEQDGELRFAPEDRDKCRLYPNDLFGYSRDELEIEINIRNLRK